ncbi:MAG: hypothetical protein IJL87_00835 [Clostridia bacterium]|nr:hypothetical protein [Clostridia bacterium]
MNKRTFLIVLYSLIALCLLLTAAHVVYAILAYQHSSIIEFISKELW